MSPDSRSLPELIEALAAGDYLAGYAAAGILDPNCQGREKTNEGKDAERALEVYVRTHAICERSAAEGDAVAQAWLALTYQCALGRDPNIELAIHWYERAFEGGQYIVANNLAAIFACEEGCPLEGHRQVSLLVRPGEGARLPCDLDR